MRIVDLKWTTGILALSATLAAEPVVLSPKFSTRDAREVVATDHGRVAQNARIDGCVTGPGALYLLPTKIRTDTAEPTPLLARLDLATGALREFHFNDNIQLRQKTDRDLAESPKTPWLWGAPVGATVLADGRVALALGETGRRTKQRETFDKEKPVVVAYDPQANTFEELGACTAPVGIAAMGGALWLLSGDGQLSRYDDLAREFDPVDRLPVECRGLIADDRYFYTTVGPAPWRVLAFQVTGKTVRVSEVLTNLDSVAFIGNRCEVVIARDGQFRRQTFELRGGKALENPAPVKAGDYEVEVNFRSAPVTVSARKPGEEWRRLPVTFRRAAWDNIRTLHGSPDGKFIYGAGWPTAWIWKFDRASNQFELFGHHYEIYEMLNCQDEVWACGYWGIKLLRWRPGEPWTFDYSRHYERKTFPNNSSPWGDKDVSNPRLVCKFRYLKQLEVRRPAGLAITDDGCAWVGGHTPAVEYFNSRFSGAVNWYDPATETIGQVREPFIHHTVRDVCRAGSNWVAAVAAKYVSAFEPLPERFSPGKFVLIDAKSRQVVHESSPLDAELSYAEEGEPDRVVVAGKTALFIFDVAKMQVTHVIQLPVKVAWQEYDHVTRFERGPDRKIYFYGKDEQGVALCRVDSVTGVVEPVLRGHNITDVATYQNTGAPFAFVGDRIYFGAQHLVSVEKP